MGRWAVLGVIALTLLTASCSAPAQPSEQEVQQARANNVYTRNIDKSRTIAADASSRQDEPALH